MCVSAAILKGDKTQVMTARDIRARILEGLRTHAERMREIYRDEPRDVALFDEQFTRCFVMPVATNSSALWFVDHAYLAEMRGNNLVAALHTALVKNV